MTSFTPSKGPIQVRRTFFSDDAHPVLLGAPTSNLNINPIENLLDYGSNIRSSMKVRPSTSKLTFFSYDLLPRSFASSTDTTSFTDNKVKFETPRPSTTPAPHEPNEFDMKQQVDRAKSSIMADLSIGSGWDEDESSPVKSSKNRQPPQKPQKKVEKKASKSSLLSEVSLGRGSLVGRRPSPSAPAIYTAMTPTRSRGRGHVPPTKKTGSNKDKGKKVVSTFTRSEFVLSSGSAYGSSSLIPPKLPKDLLQKLERLLESDNQGHARALSGYATGGGRTNRRETLRRLRAAHQILEAELEKLHVVERDYVKGKYA